MAVCAVGGALVTKKRGALDGRELFACQHFAEPQWKLSCGSRGDLQCCASDRYTVHSPQLSGLVSRNRVHVDIVAGAHVLTRGRCAVGCTSKHVSKPS